MKTPRIYIGNDLFRLDTIYGRLIQLENPDNVIHFSQLTKDGDHYKGKLGTVTKSIIGENTSTTEPSISFVLSAALLELGYKEGTLSAAELNKKYQDFNVRFIDEKALTEIENQPFIFAHRDLPEVLIDGKAFIVDAAFNELRLKGDPETFIRIDLLEEENGKYVVYRDDLYGSSNDLEGNNKILLDQMVKLDPKGMAIKYGVTVKDLPEYDSECRCDPKLLERRLVEGHLPVIRIVTGDYYVDVRMEQLSSVSNFEDSIDLNAHPRTDDSKIILFYDRIKDEIITVRDTITELPKNVVMVLLPNEVILDPVGCGRLLEGDHMAFVDKYPLQHKLEARVFPIEQSYLPLLIDINKRDALKKSQENPKEQKKKSKKNNRKL